MNFILVNKETSECELFNTEDRAKEFANELTNEYYIMPCTEVEDVEFAECSIYSNADKSSKFGNVVELGQELCHSDLMHSIDEPLKFVIV